MNIIKNEGRAIALSFWEDSEKFNIFYIIDKDVKDEFINRAKNLALASMVDPYCLFDTTNKFEEIIANEGFYIKRVLIKDLVKIVPFGVNDMDDDTLTMKVKARIDDD